MCHLSKIDKGKPLFQGRKGEKSQDKQQQKNANKLKSAAARLGAGAEKRIK